MKKIALWAVLAAAVGIIEAQPYAAWSRYREITVNTTAGGANVAGTVTNFPTLVRLTNASVAAGSNVLSDAMAGGADVRFTDSTGNTALSYEIERWSDAAAEIWVLIPSVSGNASTKIRMYWGKSGSTSASSGSAVFSGSNGFVGVWHMGNPAGAPATSVRPNSSAPGTNDATPTGFTDDPVRNGAIGPSDTLTGSSQYLNYGTLPAATFTAGGQATLSIWAYTPTALTGWVQYYTMGNTVSNNGSASMWVGKRGTGTNSIGGQNITAATNNNVTTGKSNSALSGVWQYIAFTVNNQSHILYSQGIRDSALTAGQALASVERTANYIGWSTWNADVTFPGKLDEPRLANVARSADWVKLDYETQKPGATAVTLGATQSVVARPLFYSAKSSVYVINQPIVANTATTSGAATGWSITPNTLPAGLNFNTTTGDITGTPTAVAAAAQYRVNATVGGSPAADTLTIAVTAGTPPGAPTGVTAAAGNAQATVSWSAPTSNGGAVITGYLARATQDTTKTCAWTTGALSCVITGLTNGTSYTFVVRAANAAGNSAFSGPSTAVTPASVPGAPTNVTAAAASATSITVAWTAPASNGGLAITDYYVTGAPGGQLCYSPPVASPSCTVTGLTTGTSYTFTVVAANSVGNGPASAPSNAAVPVGILSGYSIRVTGAAKPFTFALTPKAVETTDALTMTISDVYGRTVWSQTVNPRRAGVSKIVWNGRASTGRAVSAGVYMVRVSALNGGTTSEFIQKAADVK